MTPHPVETLSLDCSFGSESLAWDQQSRLENFLRGPAQRVISEVFERHGEGDGVWRLDRLELDLGVLLARDSDAEWALRLERVLDEELFRRARARGGDGNGDGDGALPDAARFQFREARDAEAFQQYLDQGVLPWSLRKSTHAEFSAWLDTVAGQDAPGLLAALAQPSRGGRLEQVLDRVLSLDALRTLTRARYGAAADAWDWAEAQPPFQGLAKADREAFQRLWHLNALKAAEAPARGPAAAAAGPLPSMSEVRAPAALSGEQAVQTLAQALERSAQAVFPGSWPALLAGLAPRSGPPELAPLLERLRKSRPENAASSVVGAVQAAATDPGFVAVNSGDAHGASTLSGPDEIERLVAGLEHQATPALRLRLAELLESWDACEAWLRTASEAGLRRLLSAQLPDAAERLHFWFEERLGADEGGPVPVGERRRRLRAFLLFHLFVEGGGTAPQSLASALNRWKSDSASAAGARPAPSPDATLPAAIAPLAEAFRRFPGSPGKTEDRPGPTLSLGGPLHAPGSVPPGDPGFGQGQSAETAQPEADRDRSELARRVLLRSWRSRVSELWDEPRLAALIGLLSVPEGVSEPESEAWDWLPAAIRAESVRLAGLDQGGAALWRRWLWSETLAQAAENGGPTLEETALRRRWQEAWERLRAPALEPEPRTPRAAPERAFPAGHAAAEQTPGTPSAAAPGPNAALAADFRADAPASATRPSPTAPAIPAAPRAPRVSATVPAPAPEGSPAPAALSFPELAELAHPSPLQRLRLMDLLAEPEACEAWLDSSTVEQRWALLDAHLPLDAARIRAGAGRRIQSPGTESAFWRLLASRLFIEGLPTRAEDWLAALRPKPGLGAREAALTDPETDSKPGTSSPGRTERKKKEERPQNAATDWEHEQATLLRLVRRRAWRFHAATTLDAAALASLLALLDWKPGSPDPDAGDWSWLPPLLESEAASLAQRFRESIPFWRRWLWATSLSYTAGSPRRLTRDSLLRHWAGALERLTAPVPALHAPAPREARSRPEAPDDAAGRSGAPRDRASTTAGPAPGTIQAKEAPPEPGANMNATPTARPGATLDGALPMQDPAAAPTPVPAPAQTGESVPHIGEAFPDAPRAASPSPAGPPSPGLSASGLVPGRGPERLASNPTPSPAGTPNEPIWVGNAGVVLLGNYLPRLFERLELVRERAFVDEAARERAIHCLDFLARGSTESSDPELALAKILCGRPLLFPTRPCPGLDEPTRDLLEGLLKAVIANWSILGGTSVAGLRESFLRREGRLTRSEDDSQSPWTLLVEPRPFDMLLDRLPWSFTPLKLAWMERMIHVEWR